MTSHLIIEAVSRSRSVSILAEYFLRHDISQAQQAILEAAELG